MFKILFLGNSHTYYNDVPTMVKKLLESDGTHRVVGTHTELDANLEDLGGNGAVLNAVKKGDYNVVVMQGLMLSESHRNNYRHEPASEIANIAIKSGKRAVFYAEWCRRGWNESDYILGEYKGAAKKAPGSEIAPVCLSWDAAIKQQPGLDMWQPDGNHAQLPGSYLAALTLYFQIAKDRKHTPKWKPDSISPATQKAFTEIARKYGKLKK